MIFLDFVILIIFNIFIYSKLRPIKNGTLWCHFFTIYYLYSLFAAFYWVNYYPPVGFIISASCGYITKFCKEVMYYFSLVGTHWFQCYFSPFVNCFFCHKYRCFLYAVYSLFSIVFYIYGYISVYKSFSLPDQVYDILKCLHILSVSTYSDTQIFSLDR